MCHKHLDQNMVQQTPQKWFQPIKKGRDVPLQLNMRLYPAWLSLLHLMHFAWSLPTHAFLRLNAEKTP
ncbi:Uncharacterised protein [Acinetobacter baumannii]|nr:Uncharacterised protein [Acinetobacter baumannii]